MNSKTKIGSMFLLAAVLVAGTISITIPSSFSITEEREYKDPYAKEYNSYGDPHEKKYAKDPRGDGEIIWDKDPKGVNVQKIKCVNFNANINGIDIKKIPREMTGDTTTAQGLQGDENDIRDGTGNGMFGNDGIKIDKNLVNICLNFNFNNQEKVPILGDLTRTAE